MDEQARETERMKWTREYELLLAAVENKPLVRLDAHIKYLDEYFLRWLGFCRVETVAPHTLVDNGLFFVIEAVSAVVGKDVGCLEASEYARIVQAWKYYRDSLATLRRHPQKVKIEAEKSYLKLKGFADTVMERPTRGTLK